MRLPHCNLKWFANKLEKDVTKRTEIRKTACLKGKCKLMLYLNTC